MNHATQHPSAGVTPSSPAHQRWLEQETDRLFAFGRASVRAAGGFARLDNAGEPEGGPAELWIACRMTHVYALAELMGRPGAGLIVEHGLDALTGLFHDDANGGWFASVGADGTPVEVAKAAYPHAFVILAASSAVAAGHDRALALLTDALAISEAHFWDDAAGMVVEEWDETFTSLDAYRGVNANMHTVEAYLAAADVTGDVRWLHRALRIVERVVHNEARANDWRIPEHFDSDWNVLLDYNIDQPADPFRPFGATIGHWFEWSRLALHTHAALAARGDAAPSWLIEDAVSLFDAAAATWGVDGTAGFVYTVDWQGTPVVRERMHWVHAEAVAAAAVVRIVTGNAQYDAAYRQYWDFIAAHFIDPVGGSWWHELSPEATVSQTVWDGKADLYHAVQATLIPRLPVAPVLAPALASGLLS